jgi:hypothetical protein
MIVTRKTHPGGCTVFDANGLEWKALRWVNTETGEAEQCVLDANGFKQLDASMKILTDIYVQQSKDDSSLWLVKATYGTEASHA